MKKILSGFSRWTTKENFDTKIQEDNKDERKKIEKSITAMCKKEAISFEQVFYILFFEALAFRVQNLFEVN